MIRKTQMYHKEGLPCLGGIPGIGALFSKNSKDSTKKNIIIFVRPRIIRSTKDYQELTDSQEELYKSETSKKEDFVKGINLVKDKDLINSDN